MKETEYEIMYRVENTHWWYHGLRAMFAQLRKRYVHTPSPRILDVGCGCGANLATLRPPAKGVGIDFSPAALRFCRTRGLHRTSQASAEYLPFKDGSFDVVYSFDVICHQSLPDPMLPLREMQRVLAPGGILILNLPAHEWLRSSHDVHVQTGHRFSRVELEGLLTEAKLEVRYMTYWNGVLFPIIVPIRLWRKRHAPPTSDLEGRSGIGLSPIFSAALAFERALLRLAPLPTGLSIICVAEKR